MPNPERYPVMLVHGIAARDQSISQSSVWGRVPRYLRERGYSVWFGCQDAFGSVEENARQIARSIEEALQLAGAERMRIIAHSKGGIDSRAALLAPHVAERVASVTTLATPHRGLRFCDKLAASRLIIPHVVAPVVNAQSRREGDTRANSLQALAGLTTKSAGELLGTSNPGTTGVPLRSVGFVRDKSDARRNWRPVGAVVKHLDGDNDGIVALASTNVSDIASWMPVYVEAGQRFDHADATDARSRDVRLRLPDGTNLSSIPELVHLLLESDEADKRKTATKDESRTVENRNNTTSPNI